jgi:hypothetical protein
MTRRATLDGHLQLPPHYFPGKIGIVTVLYNSAQVLEGFFASIEAQTYREFIVYCVDNQSTDGSGDLCARRGLPYRLISNAANLGVAAGNNQGIRAAIADGCEYVLLINNDTEFESDLVAKLLEAARDDSVDMVCPKILYFDVPDVIWAAGGKFQPLFGHRCIHIGENEIDKGQYDKRRFVQYVPTCCVLIRRSVFEDVGLMDSRYFVYVDDVDFMFRAARAGKRLLYVPEATLLHKVGRLTGGEASPFSIRMGTRNRIFFHLKHFGLLRTIPWIAVRELSWIFSLAVNGRGLSWFRLKNSALREAMRLYSPRVSAVDCIPESPSPHAPEMRR